MNDVKKAKIVFIDDMRTNFLAVSLLLKPYNFEVLYEADSLKGVAAVEHELPDAVLLDFDMPNLNGPQVCRLLRANPLTKEIPILFFTANIEPKSLIEAYDAGGDDYTTKTAPAKELVARLGRMIQNRALTAELQQRYEEQATLTRMVSHDINNLLTVANAGVAKMAEAETILVDPEAAKFKKALGRAQGALHRIQDLIANVRELQSLDDQKLSIDLKPVKLSLVFEECKDVFLEKLAAKNLELEIINDDSFTVMSDYNSLCTSVLNNIVSNSIKFSNENGKIEIRTAAKSGQILLQIRDHGIGMNQELLSKVFSKSEKTSRPGTKNEKGTGFGMPIVKKYMDLYGGSIQIQSRTVEESKTDCGTTILLTFKIKLAPYNSD